MSNDALGSLAKTDVPGKLYDDLVHPAAQSIGKTAGFIPRTIGVWLGRWECWIANGEESIKRTIEATGEKAQAIPEGWKFDVRRWTYCVTNYGRNFIKICTDVGTVRSITAA